MAEQLNIENWTIVERPGYFGSRKTELENKWDTQYGYDEHGQRNWKIAWESSTGEPLTFEQIFEEYIQGYAQHFRENPEALAYLVNNACFIYDLDPNITKKQAFNPTALVGIPGIPNQFHHVAINLAIVKVLGINFMGKTALQARGLNIDTPLEDWPIPALLQPGFIQCLRPELIRQPEKLIWWIQKYSIEGLYQYNKVILVKIS